MITKISSITKYIAVIVVFLISLIACEKDFKDIGIDLVDNNEFDTDILISNIIAFNLKVDSVRVDSLPQYVLGVNQSNLLGKTTASIATQISLPVSNITFGENPTIDSVILDIPYYNTLTGTQKVPDLSTEDETDSIVVPVFELDSIIGNKDNSIIITVSELATFLNDLNPLDPTKRKRYYSNKTYALAGAPLFSGRFTPDANDTVAYIKHRNLKGDVFEIDSIKRVDAIPSMKFALDEDFFANNFLNQSNSAIFSSSEEFSHFFRGLYITATGTDGSLITVPLSNGSVSIFYSNDENVTDGNGATTVSRVAQVHIFPLVGIAANKFEHDYSTATSNIQARLQNPDKINGEQKLYLQGASGSMILLDLFLNENLNDIRSKNWLINEANIKLFVDKDESNSYLPNRLFLYNYDDNSHMVDLFSEGAAAYDGKLHYDDNGDPDYYRFRITAYISRILKKEGSFENSKLAVRAFSPFDIPSFLRLSDTIVKPFNWNPKGVSLFGNRELGNKKLSLEIFYTEPINQ